MFEKNIEAIKLKNPELAEKLQKIDFDSIEGIVVTEAENQELVIGYKETALHSLVDPIREARAIWNKNTQSELKKNDVQIVFGLGLGYLFKRAYVNANSKIILVEPFLEVLRFVLQHVDLSSELSDERVYLTDNVNDVETKLKTGYLQGDKTEFLFLPAYSHLAKETLENLSAKVIKIIEEKSSDINTIAKFGDMWTKNLIKNMPNFFDTIPLGYLQNQFINKTALIISAGPSLAENIEKIKQNKDKFVTIATGKAFKVLIENDIIPDFVSFVDPTGFKRQFEGTENFLAKTNFIIASRVDSDAVDSLSKNKIVYLPETDQFSKLFQKYSEADPGVYESASSISIINYFIAKAMGFNNIAFTGLDLAFPDNKIYATGEVIKTDENGYIIMETPSPGKTVKYVKDINGNDIPTRDDYIVFIRQFEDIFEEEMSLTRIINTSVRGARVQGMDYMQFDDFVETLSPQEIDFDNIIKETFDKTKYDWNNTVQNVFGDIFSQKPKIEKLREEAELVYANIDQILQNSENDIFEEENFSSLSEKLADIRNQVIKIPVISTSLQDVLWKYTKNFKKDNLMDKKVLIENLKTEKELLRPLINRSKLLLGLLERSSLKIEENKYLLRSAN